MIPIREMARAYLDALAPSGFRDPEEREMAVLQRIAPMRAALREAERMGFKLVPVDPALLPLCSTQAGGAVLWENDAAPWLAGDVYRSMLSAAPGIEEG